MIIGTAGHIDHGKTALVKALTGVDADRLPEEKRRGMTIDLGFAYRIIPAEQAAGGERVLGFIDVPGHERFVHNMLAGATGIDFALLVVAADDGPMPQTREHLEILSLLGLDQGVVALTKADLVSAERLAEAETEVRELLAGSSLRAADIVPVSSVTGAGIKALEQRLTAAARAVTARAVRGEFRMAIDRRFVLAGVGVVVTGTVTAGSISVGDRAILTPSGTEVRIRGIHAHNRPKSSGWASDRCALNLAGPHLDRQQVRRGEWVVAPALYSPTERIDARLRLLCRDARVMKAGTAGHLHLGTAHVAVRMASLGGDALVAGEEANVQLVLERPIGAWRGDRLILRDISATRTIGGGIVLDPCPPVRGRRRPQRLAALAALAIPEPATALAGVLEASPAGVDLDRFALSCGLTRDEAASVWSEAGVRILKAEGRRHGFGLTPARFEALRSDLHSVLTAHHQTTPQSPGLELDRLRLALAERPPPAIFRAVVRALVQDGTLALRGAAIHLPGHNAALPDFDQRLWGRIRLRLDESGFEPPWVRDFARELSQPENVVRQLMKRLARMGEVIEIVPDRFYRRKTVYQMASMLAELCRSADDGAVTAATFRDRIGTGRKLAIIILEFFDRTGITIRRGDSRKVRPERVESFAETNL
jgi:selenocysteine-specific elongation factor